MVNVNANFLKIYDALWMEYLSELRIRNKNTEFFRIYDRW